MNKLFRCRPQILNAEKKNPDASAFFCQRAVLPNRQKQLKGL